MVVQQRMGWPTPSPNVGSTARDAVCWQPGGATVQANRLPASPAPHLPVQGVGVHGDATGVEVGVCLAHIRAAQDCPQEGAHPHQHIHQGQVPRANRLGLDDPAGSDAGAGGAMRVSEPAV